MNMRITFTLVTLLLLAAPSLAQQNRPNIVIIRTDDLGYGHVGCYNAGSKIATPRLDALAKEGVRFTDAHAPAALCTPTRYGLITGRSNPPP